MRGRSSNSSLEVQNLEKKTLQKVSTGYPGRWGNAQAWMISVHGQTKPQLTQFNAADSAASGEIELETS